MRGIGGAALAAVMTIVFLPAVPSAHAGTAPADDGRLDVLFVGAHPDDEASGLSTTWTRSTSTTRSARR